jgi:hypothetical protein
VSSAFPSGKSLDPQCSATSAPIYEHASYWSADGGQSSKELSRFTIPDDSGVLPCDPFRVVVTTLYEKGSWKDPTRRNLSAPPPPIHVHFTFKNVRANTIFESPWVLVDANAIP